MQGQAVAAESPEVPDGELIARAAAGDSDCFAELYRRHADAAFRSAMTVVSNPDDAADAVAEAFTKILRRVRGRRHHGIRHFRAYLLTAVRHAALDRRSSMERAFDRESLALADQPASDPSPTEVVIDLTDETYAVRAYRALPERWQRVLWLTAVEGLRPVDIAHTMDMNANSVAQLTFRARSRLREEFVRVQFGDVDDPVCEAVVEQLVSHVAGKLAADRAVEVERHLEGCGTCAQRRDEIVLLSRPSRPHGADVVTRPVAPA